MGKIAEDYTTYTSFTSSLLKHQTNHISLHVQLIEVSFGFAYRQTKKARGMHISVNYQIDF